MSESLHSRIRQVLGEHYDPAVPIVESVGRLVDMARAADKPKAKGGRRHGHYFKPCPFAEVDVYRALRMFEVTDAAIGHAAKKLLCAGMRGAKPRGQDIREAIETLERWEEMEEEDAEALELVPSGAPKDHHAETLARLRRLGGAP